MATLHPITPHPITPHPITPHPITPHPINVQPAVFWASFLQSQTQSLIWCFGSLLPRSVEKRPIRLRSENEIELRFKCNRPRNNLLTEVIQNIWISRLDPFRVHSFEWRAHPFTAVKTCLRFWRLLWNPVWKLRGIPRIFFEISVVVNIP